MSPIVTACLFLAASFALTVQRHPFMGFLFFVGAVHFYQLATGVRP